MKPLTKIFALYNLGMSMSGCRPEDGVPDMTVISDINEVGINSNLRVRYNRDQVYVSLQQPFNPS